MLEALEKSLHSQVAEMELPRKGKVEANKSDAIDFSGSEIACIGSFPRQRGSLFAVMLVQLKKRIEKGNVTSDLDHLVLGLLHLINCRNCARTVEFCEKLEPQLRCKDHDQFLELSGEEVQ